MERGAQSKAREYYRNVEVEKTNGGTTKEARVDEKQGNMSDHVSFTLDNLTK